MKNIKFNATSLFLLLLIFSACSKSKEPQSESAGKSFNPLSGITAISDNDFGMVTVSAQTPHRIDTPNSAHTLYSLNGLVQDTICGTPGANIVNAGDLLINGTQVTKVNNQWNIGSLSHGASCFGSFNTFKITGNSPYDSGSARFYIPAKIIMSSPLTYQLSKSNGVTVTWTPDQNYNGQTYIKVQYKGALSHDHNSSLPSADVYFNDQVSDALGSYTITSGQLSNMPVGGFVEITIGRGSYSEASIGNDKSVLFVGAAITSLLMNMTN
jgi:hypothetical protein